MKKDSNPIKFCCLCLRKVGFGYTTIGRLTSTDKALCRKWIEKSGIFPKVSKEDSQKLRHKRASASGWWSTRRLKQTKKIEDDIACEYRMENAQWCKLDNMVWQSKLLRTLPNVIGQRRRRHNDPAYKLKFYARKRVKQAFKYAYGAVKRSPHISKLFGCTSQELLEHIQSKFRDGMTLDNHGVVWEIDHIRPLASFNLLDPSHLSAACHYTNLQPLLVHENRYKSDKFSGPSSLGF